jgi:hypothetical protein
MTLRDLHAYCCSQSDDNSLECEADEDDGNETGVCAVWDSLRDAWQIGADEERAACLFVALSPERFGGSVVAKAIASDIQRRGYERRRSW